VTGSNRRDRSGAVLCAVALAGGLAAGCSNSPQQPRATTAEEPPPHAAAEPHAGAPPPAHPPAHASAHAPAHDAPPPRSVKEAIAIALDRPEDALRILAKRPIVLLYDDGRYASYQVRDLRTNETIGVAIDVRSGATIDEPALRRADREAAKTRAAKMEDRLRRLVLDYPELKAVRVRLRVDPDEVLAGTGQSRVAADLMARGINAVLEPVPGQPAYDITLSARDVGKVGNGELYERISLVSEPLIFDD
jgi:hypothetical protein